MLSIEVARGPAYGSNLDAHPRLWKVVDTINCFSQRRCGHADDHHGASKSPLEDGVQNMGDAFPYQRSVEVHEFQNVDSEVDATSRCAPYQEVLDYH